MDRRRRVKCNRPNPLGALLASTLLACSAAPRTPTAGTPAAPLPVSSEPADSTAVQAVPAANHPLVPLTPDELNALRPLLPRGVAMLVRNPDAGAEARITLLACAHAPLETVHRVVTTPDDYATFMPIMRTVDVLTRHGNRTAFRFHVAAPLFDVSALCAMTDVSERRVDVAMVQSDTGPGGSRWDLLPDGPGGADTLVALTTWGDPSQGHWLLRQLARRSPAAVAGMSVSADTVLALGVVRRSEILAGAHSPSRPPVGEAPTGPLEPPPAGPWMSLSHGTAVLAVSLTPDGAVTQVTVATWTSAPAAAVEARLRDIPRYGSFWGSVHDVSVVSTASADEVRFHSTIVTPLTRLEGDQVFRAHGNTFFHEGVSGDFAGGVQRWDLLPDAAGGTVVALTGGSDYNRAGWLTRALMDRDPWLVAGFAGSWKIVWLRHLVMGL